MSKYFLFSSFFIICFSSCQDEQSNLVEDGDVLTSDLDDTCSCSSLEVDSLDTYTKNGVNYTGVCVENYPETDLKYIEKNILSGKLHGNVTYFDKEGNVLIEEIYENGISKRSSKNDAITCDCTELEEMKLSNSANIKRYSLDGIPFTGKCESYYPETNQLYIESNYKNGFLNGYTIYYKKDGANLYMEKYVMGRLENTIY